jgi:hypothetical protein
MDNVQNCDSYINAPSVQTHKSYLPEHHLTPANVWWSSNVRVWNNAHYSLYDHEVSEK